MKLYVEEQDMPPNCAECKAEGHYENSYGDEYGFFCPFGYKAYTSGTRDTKRLDNCPFVPVPPHGDLIEKSVIEKAINDACAECEEMCLEFDGLCADCDNCVLSLVKKALTDAPTVIPADPAEEGET